MLKVCAITLGRVDVLRQVLTGTLDSPIKLGYRPQILGLLSSPIQHWGYRHPLPCLDFSPDPRQLSPRPPEIGFPSSCGACPGTQSL